MPSNRAGSPPLKNYLYSLVKYECIAFFWIVGVGGCTCRAARLLHLKPCGWVVCEVARCFDGLSRSPGHCIVLVISLLLFQTAPIVQVQAEDTCGDTLRTRGPALGWLFGAEDGVYRFFAVNYKKLVQSILNANYIFFLLRPHRSRQPQILLHIRITRLNLPLICVLRARF